MLLSHQADYGLRVMQDVAFYEHKGNIVITREIADRQHIPRVFLTKIVANLASTGLLHTQRGKGGGITLGRPATEINLLEIIEASEGRLMFNECTQNPNGCCINEGCGIRTIWVDAETHLRLFFKERKLSELIIDYNPSTHTKGFHGSSTDPIQVSELLTSSGK